MKSKRRIGIMGGTFNPIHIGHLILAQKAYEEYELDEIIFITSGDPPHKQVGHISATMRGDMTRLAVEDNPIFQYSDMEIKREGYSYTYLTLLELREIYADAELYFLLGADSLFYLEKWKRPDIIMQNAVILAANRNTNNEQLYNKIDELKKDYDADIRIIDMPNIDISSSFIRHMVNIGRSVKYYVPDLVIDYIKENNLYLDGE